MDTCDTTFTITDQTDINNGPLRLCQDSQNSTITVRNATGTLTFPNLTRAYQIDVRDSPQLKILDLPDLDKTYTLSIGEAPSLTNISLPFLGSSYNCSDATTYFIITSAPSLVNIELRDFNCLNSISLFDVGKLESVPSQWNLPSAVIQSDVCIILSRWNAPSGSISTDVCLDLSDLSWAGELYLSGQYCSYDMRKLTLVQSLILSNSASILPIDSVMEGESAISTFQVEHDMLLHESIGNPNVWPLDFEREIRVGTVGWDLNITSNSNVNMAFDDLTEVGKSLYISNNTNCTFNFKSLSTVNTLIFTDNVGTMMPFLSSLEKAESIQINGLINTAIGPNIFPALRSALNVTVNALNDDFDCSTLVSQRDSQIIHNLQCVGKNSGPSSQTLTMGAWAGIGVSTGLVAIGILGALIWLIVHYRSRVKILEIEKARRSEENASSKEPNQPHMFQTQEVCGRGIFREKPDDPLVEMPTQPAELPTRPHSRVETEPEVGQAS